MESRASMRLPRSTRSSSSGARPRHPLAPCGPRNDRALAATSRSSCPGLSRVSTSLEHRREIDVDGRDMPGHDAETVLDIRETARCGNLSWPSGHDVDKKNHPFPFWEG